MSKFESERTYDKVVQCEAPELIGILAFAALRSAESDNHCVSAVNCVVGCDCGNPDCENDRPSLLFCFHEVGASDEEIVDCAFAGLKIQYTPAEDCNTPRLAQALAAVHQLAKAKGHQVPNEGLGDGVMQLEAGVMLEGFAILQARAIKGSA